MRLPWIILSRTALYFLLSFSLVLVQARIRYEEVARESEPLNEWKEHLSGCWTGLKADKDSPVCASGSTTGTDNRHYNHWEALLQSAQAFNPAHIAEKLRDSILGTINSESSHSPSDEPDRPKQPLESLLSDELSKILNSFENMVNTAIELWVAFNSAVDSSSASSNPSLNPLFEKLAKFAANVRDDIISRFPLPATAPGHARRVARASEVLNKIEQVVVQLAKSNKIEQEVIKRYIASVRPYMQDLSVLIGDIGELYPGTVEAVVLNLSGMLLPEAAFVRSLMILYCFGPFVLGKDAIGGWLLKHVMEDFKG